MNTKSERIIELFTQALAINSAQERASFLAEACRDQPDLRQEIESLLGAGARAPGDFLKQPASALTMSMSLPPSEKPGDRIGRYKLLEQIGEGGCGVVYVAEQEEPVRRRVALKIIKLGMDTKQVIARFDAERQALALMDHPNIAKVHDAGSTETGRPYFVMELVRGIKITDYCDQNHLPPRERLDLFIQVCRAIQHAHQKGIIHRDIKPSNILVTLHDGVPVPKVIDFGIAKATQGRLTDQTVYTAFEQFIGTPAYMSPEQATMSGLDIDTRSDIYSLGVLLYELLTGTTPFDAKELLSKGLDEMRRTIREVEPVKPSTRLTQELTAADMAGRVAPRAPSSGENVSVGGAHGVTRPTSQLRELIHLLRGDLDWIVMKCLEKDRTRRYETANGLATDLVRHLNNEPIVARPPSRLYRFQKTVQRNRLAFGAAVAVVLALIVGFVVSMAMFFQAQDERKNAEAEKKTAQTEAVKSQQVARFLKDMLNGVDASVALGRDTTLLREILDRTAERIDTELTNQPLVEAELREIMGNVYFETGPIDKAEAMHRQTLAIRKRLFGEEDLRTAHSFHELGYVLWRQERHAEAEVVTRRAWEIRTKLAGSDTVEASASLANLGGILVYEGKLIEAETAEREAVRILRKRGRDVKLAFALRFLAETLNQQNKPADAESALREALTIQQKHSDWDNRDRAETLRFLGQTLQQGKKLNEAESCFREAVSIHRKLSDPQRNPYLAWTLEQLASLLITQGRLAEAEDACRETWHIRRLVVGNTNPGTIRSLNSLVALLRQQGREAEAQALLQGQTNTVKAPQGK